MKEKKKLNLKWLFRIGIGVVVFAIVVSLLFQMFNRHQGARLVEGQQRQDAAMKVDKVPTAEEFAATIPSVIRRASDVRDFTYELQVINEILRQFDEANSTSSSVNIVNYLGKYKVVIRVGIVEEIEAQKLHTATADAFATILTLNPDFARVEVDVISGSTQLERYYIASSETPVLVFDRKYSEDLAKGETPKCVSKFEKLQSEFLNSQISVTGYTTEEYDSVTVTIDTSAADDGTAECIDYIDFAFQMINDDLQTPVYLQVIQQEKTSSEGEVYDRTLVFSGLIVPEAKTFKDFYTAKPYYQDVSRAEYYLCNDWLYGNVLTTLSTYIDNLI